MSGNQLSVEQTLNILARTPSHLTALTAGLDPVQLRTAPDQDTWSANQVLAHLRSCADVWGNCMLAILAEDHPTLRAINPTTWINSTNYLELEFEPSLRAYDSQRAKLLAVLQPLPPESWSRSATVTGAGKPLERNVQFYGQWLARHERSHYKQIESVVRTIKI